MLPKSGTIKKGIKKRIMRLINQVNGLLRLMIDKCSMLYPVRHHKNNSQVCIVRLDALGDFISWLPVAEILCAHYRERDAEIILIANESWGGFAADLDLFTKVIPINRDRYLSNFFYRFNANRVVRNLSCNLVIHSVYRREFYLGDSLVKVIKAREKIGFNCIETDKRHRTISDQWYTKLVDTENVAHQFLMAYLMLDKLNIAYKNIKFGSTRLESVIHKKSKKILNMGDYYVVAPGASWVGKSWPVEKWSKLCRLISENTQASGIIIGSKKDEFLGWKIVAKNPQIYDLTGKTSILEMASVISRARFVITNDSSPVHFAMQLGVQSFCILGGGHYGQFLPIPQGIEMQTPPIIANRMLSCYGCNWNCPYLKSSLDSVKCIEDISVEQVFNLIIKSGKLDS
jgi:ADP-heptose:LPS heptosyltransferase